MTVVVLNFNGGADVIRCMESIRRANLSIERLATVVVDNGSVDGSAEEIERAFAEVELIRAGENLGYCEGNNVGLRRALARGSDFVLLLNDDATLNEDAIEKMVATMMSDETIGIVGPKIVRMDDPLRLWSAGGEPAFGANVLRLIGNGDIDRGQFEISRDVPFVPGCALLIRRKVLETVGLLDPDYFAYFEDADLCFRAREEGYRVWYEASALIQHRVSASSGGGVSPLRKYLMGLNSIRFLRTHGTWTMWLSLVVCDLIAYPAMLIASVLRGERRAAWAKGRGLVAGLFGRSATAADVGRFFAPRGDSGGGTVESP